MYVNDSRRGNILHFNIKESFHYGFPKIGVFITLIPKCGSMEVLSKLIAFERQETRKETRVWHSSRQARGYQIYSQLEAEKYSERILILRDPVQRLISFYNDKVIDSDDKLYQWMYRHKNWAISERLNEIGSRGSGFENFVKELCDLDSRLHDDKHLRKQFSFALPIEMYTSVIQTPQITTFFENLGLPLQGRIKNRSSQQIKISDISSELIDQIKEYYADDYLILEKSLKYSQQSPATSDDMEHAYRPSMNRLVTFWGSITRIISASPSAIIRIAFSVTQNELERFSKKFIK
jgi:hypothetical protein